MTDEQPLEESAEVADAVDDETAISEFETGGEPDADNPVFREPGWQPRTGAEQPWDPEDLAEAEGKDPTPENVARAKAELDEDGPAAIDRTVP
ncbi:hypothetical protein [Asanoa sp. NPDC050611]|uniref:hypothetical protein n=1 Tax=Asanoa sp. NPDC050611 TaxID=3157098 RepID=UPI0033FED0D1